MIKAEIVAHSRNEQGDELISVLCTFPRIILAEVNTHRMLSKNTSSSRAIPFKKMVESVQNDPFVPIAWQKEHKGMQGSEYLVHTEANEEDWLKARDYAIEYAENLNNGGQGVTKQLCNRLLEPFMWTTMLITGPRSGWDNFFNLRCPQYQDINTVRADGKGTYYKSKKEYEISANVSEYEDFVDFDWKEINQGQAEIHIMDLAEKIYDALNKSTPEQLKAGEWHIPFGNKIHKVDTSMFSNPTSVEPAFDLIRVKISTAMAARTSYTVVGEEKDIDSKKMIELHDRLLTQDPPHSSPMEHCARAMNEVEYTSSKATGYTRKGKDQYGWCRNFKGFIPYRHIIEEDKK